VGNKDNAQKHEISGEMDTDVGMDGMKPGQYGDIVAKRPINRRFSPRNALDS